MALNQQQYARYISIKQEYIQASNQLRQIIATQRVNEQELSQKAAAYLTSANAITEFENNLSANPINPLKAFNFRGSRASKIHTIVLSIAAAATLLGIVPISVFLPFGILGSISNITFYVISEFSRISEERETVMADVNASASSYNAAKNQYQSLMNQRDICEENLYNNDLELSRLIMEIEGPVEGQNIINHIHSSGVLNFNSLPLDYNQQPITIYSRRQNQGYGAQAQMINPLYPPIPQAAPQAGTAYGMRRPAQL